MMRLAVLVSGNGTNLQALLDAREQGLLSHGMVVLVLSDAIAAPALDRARKAGIAAYALERRALGRQQFEKALLALLERESIDIVVLAGFLTILSEHFIMRYRSRIINIHPSLIPSFCGKGYYGRRVHEAALARGVKLSGATVHLATEAADAGPILAQEAIAVLADDTPESLGQRILEEVEWKILPKAVEEYCRKMETLSGRIGLYRYPGRGIVCALTEDGKALVAYFITARSSHSKNRRLVSQGTSIHTEAVDASLVLDPSLIIYRAMDFSKDVLVVSNGDQTDTILSGLSDGKDLDESLLGRTYEPDAPNYTPRISAIFTLQAAKPSYTFSILRKNGESCERATFPYTELQKGEAHLIHTYEGGDNPLLSFSASPWRVSLGKSEDVAAQIWESLDKEYRVGLCVRIIELGTNQYHDTIINAQERRD